VTDDAYREIILGEPTIKHSAHVSYSFSGDVGATDVRMRDSDNAAVEWSWLGALHADHPDLYQMLQCCAFLRSSVAPLSWFATGDSNGPDAKELEVSLSAGIAQGVIRVDSRPASIQLHPSLRAVLRDRLTAEESAPARGETYRWLADLDPAAPTSPENWRRYRELLPHGRVPGVLESDDSRVRALVVNLVRYLYFAGDQQGAAEFADRVWEVWSADGETDAQVLDLASVRGLIHWTLGRYATAAEINQAALATRREMAGEQARETIVARLRVALDLRTQGAFIEARKQNAAMHNDAVDLFGENDPITLQTAHDLAVVSRLCGDAHAALELDTRTSDVRSRVLGPDSSDTLNTRSGVHVDHGELGYYSAALDGHKAVAERVAELVGDEAPGTLLRRAYLAVALRRAGEHEAALALSTRTYGLMERVYGQDHPYTLACGVGHATDLRNDGRLDESYAMGERVRKAYGRVFTDEHPMTLAATANAAITLRMRGDAEDARKHNQLTFDRFIATLGAEHPHAIACAANLASDLAELGDLDGAVRVGTEAHVRAEKNTLGSQHPTTLAVRANLDLDRRGHETQARTRVNCDVDPLPL